MGEDYTWPSWDDLLRNEAKRNGWALPESVWWQRLAGVRHLRSVFLNVENAHDYWKANMIWRGRC